MPDIMALIQTGQQIPGCSSRLKCCWGPLHALEPEHSKPIMAASIIAVRETPAQAAVLDISAAIGHTLVVCIIALVGFIWARDSPSTGRNPGWC